MSTSNRDPQHIEAARVAEYLDGALLASERDALEAHFAICATCRAELIEITQLLRRRRPRWLPLATGAALAAMFLLVLWSRGDNAWFDRVHRGPPADVPSTLVPVSPMGPVPIADTIRWRSSRRYDRYRVRLFNADGRLLMFAETLDTLAGIPDSIILRPTVDYYWKVEGRVALDRWVGSPMIVFTVEGQRP